jgi:hypothetical protein
VLPSSAIRPFVPPANSIYHDIPCGRPRVRASRRKKRTARGRVDLSQYDMVVGFGDSLIRNLVRRESLFNSDNHPSGDGGFSFWSDRLFYADNVARALGSDEDVGYWLTKLEEWHGANLTDHTMKSAVITGSALWDLLFGVMDTEWQNHARAVRQFVAQFRERFPGVDLYWKSPSALHFYRMKLLRANSGALHRERARYMSAALVRQLYQVQKDISNELDVPFLDLYDAYYLSGPWTRTAWDARHYKDEISAVLLSFYWSDLDVDGSCPRSSG